MRLAARIQSPSPSPSPSPWPEHPSFTSSSLSNPIPHAILWITQRGIHRPRTPMLPLHDKCISSARCNDKCCPAHHPTSHVATTTRGASKTGPVCPLPLSKRKGSAQSMRSLCREGLSSSWGSSLCWIAASRATVLSPDRPVESCCRSMPYWTAASRAHPFCAGPSHDGR